MTSARVTSRADDALAIRAIYGDTDQMGIVYYANFLRWFEAARGHFIRVRGMSYGDLERAGAGLPVVEVNVRYRRPARYDDLVVVHPLLEHVGNASLRFSYRVTRGDDLLAEGTTAHACVGTDGRPTRLPDVLLALLGAPAAP